MVTEQRSPRTRLFIRATLHVGPRYRPVTIRDLSETGARIELAEPPPSGTTVQLRRGSLSVQGQVAWANARTCGMQFEAPIVLEEWIPNASQQKVDEAIREVRAGRQSAVPADSPPTGSADVTKRIAQEIEFVARMLEALGDGLTDDPYVAGRHGLKLQDLDIAIQILGHLGRLLVAEDPEAGIDQIGRAELRRRLAPRNL